MSNDFPTTNPTISPPFWELSPGDIARTAVDSLVEDFSQQKFRVGFAVAMLTSALLARSGMRFLPTLVIGVTAGSTAEHLYGMAEDIHAAICPAPVQMPWFHGVVGCLGHRPDEYTQDCPDATGKV